MMQFGANDNGGKGALKGTGEETQEAEGTVVHTFGWYLRQYVKEAREKGAVPVICSLTPRKSLGADGHFQRANSTHVAWAAEVAKEQGVPFVDLYELIARQHEKLGAAKVDLLYVPTPTEKLHPGWDGAVLDAECVVAGLKGLKANPLGACLSKRGQAIAPAATP